VVASGIEAVAECWQQAKAPKPQVTSSSVRTQWPSGVTQCQTRRRVIDLHQE
jgi:hypothetical protein